MNKIYYYDKGFGDIQFGGRVGSNPVRARPLQRRAKNMENL
jgi:hypothetical protein